MKSFLKINLTLCLLFAIQVLQAQTDIKINPLGLLFKNIGVAAEFGVKENFGVEATGGIGFGSLSFSDEKFNSQTVRAGVNGRYYFNPDKGLDRFYGALYTRYAGGKWTSTVDDGELKSTRVSAGFIFGTKIIAKNERLIFDFGLGLGRAFVYKFDPNSEGQEEVNLDDIPLLNLDIPIYLSIGYRF